MSVKVFKVNGNEKIRVSHDVKSLAVKDVDNSLHGVSYSVPDYIIVKDPSAAAPTVAFDISADLLQLAVMGAAIEELSVDGDTLYKLSIAMTENNFGVDKNGHKYSDEKTANSYCVCSKQSSVNVLVNDTPANITLKKNLLAAEQSEEVVVDEKYFKFSDAAFEPVTEPVSVGHDVIYINTLHDNNTNKVVYFEIVAYFDKINYETFKNFAKVFVETVSGKPATLD